MATATTSPASTTTWKLDPAHSSAEFKVKHIMISNVKGSFSGLTGTLSEHATDASLSTIEASVPVATVSTGDPQRDGHLKSADFFDAEKYPEMTFKSTSVVKKGEGGWEIAVAGAKAQTLLARHVIVATGSNPRALPGAPFDEKSILSNDGALAIAEVPKTSVGKFDKKVLRARYRAGELDVKRTRD